MRKTAYMKFIPFIIMIIGLGMIVLAFAADLVGLGGQGGFGTKQKLLVLAGSLIMVFGLSLALPAGRRVYERLLHPTENDQVAPPVQSVREKAIIIFLIAIWFGLATGYAETIFRLIRKFIYGDILGMSKQFPWMIPVADLVLFSVIGLLLFLLALLWSKAASMGVLTFVFSFAMVMSLYYVKPKIIWYTAIILAVGISLQLARFLAKRQGGFYRIVGRSLPWMAGFLVAVAAGMLIFVP